MTALGATLVFAFNKVGEKAFCFLLSSAAGIMLASTFFSLLLPAIESGGENLYIILSLGFLLGGLLIILTDLFLSKKTGFCTDDKKRQSFIMVFAVTAHNVPEGLAIGVAFGALAQSSQIGSGAITAVSAIMLAFGIGIQNVPEGMCIAFPIRANGASRLKSFLIGNLSGTVEIVAGVLGALAVGLFKNLLPWALAFSAGAMIAVICSELVPESFKKSKIIATLGILLGFVLMMFLDVALG
ncbi:MAG: ZIP family metal transporter [Clostridiales bacterium]|nr:ZIP family metal transporter [Clostridiales bacterium]